ncbi:MAG: N-acetylneuraminate synthase family protein [Caldilineaceae bacterium]|nr:N-acetylneuraminate synthase family protein [Caldilineaceae bacterium]
MERQPTIELDGRPVGEGHPVYIIAEAGVNHNGSLKMALQLVDLAAAAGADAVKFQKRNLESLYPKHLLDNPNSAEWAFQYMLPILKQGELDMDAFRTIASHCEKKGIRFLCTPWDVESLDFLEELDLPFYKVSSADMVNFPLLDAIVRTGKPLILSTGMAALHEIRRTVDFLEEQEADFAILHCISTYPAPFENLNLRFINVLKQFGVPVGYSSHERGITMPVVAVTLGASIIEKHITLDRTLPGPDHAASLEEAGITKLIRDIRNTEVALGTEEKYLSAMEILNRQVLRKSLIATECLEPGTVISREMVGVKGPGKGLSPQRVDDLIGIRLKRKICTDEYFTEEDLTANHNQRIRSSQLSRPWGLKARFHDLAEILEKKPRLVELHFSEHDVDHTFAPVDVPHTQQLFVHAPEFMDSQLLDLCTPNDEHWERSIELLQRTIDKAVELRPHFTGPVGMVVHVGGMSMDEDTSNRSGLLHRAADALKRLDTKGVVLMPENLPPRPWYFGGQWYQNVFIRPEEMVEFCQDVGGGMALDLSHAQLYCTYAGRSLHEYVTRCLPFVKHLHVADAAGIDGEGMQIGEGVIDWDDILPILSQSDFTWVPEIWSGHLYNGAGFVRAINELSQYGVL